MAKALQWRHNERHSDWNDQHLDCFLSRLFRRTSKKTSKFRATGLREGNPPVTIGFPSQRPSNAENVSTWWHHHAMSDVYCAFIIYISCHLLYYMSYIVSCESFSVSKSPLVLDDALRPDHFILYWISNFYFLVDYVTYEQMLLFHKISNSGMTFHRRFVALWLHGIETIST